MLSLGRRRSLHASTVDPGAITNPVRKCESVWTPGLTTSCKKSEPVNSPKLIVCLVVQSPCGKSTKSVMMSFLPAGTWRKLPIERSSIHVQRL